MKTPTIKDIRTAAAARRARRERGRRWAIIGAALLAVLVLAVVVVLPRVARSQLQTRLAAELERPVAVGKVTLNPFTLTATVRDLRVQDKDDGLLVAWSRLAVNLDGWAWVRGRYGFDAIELDGFEGRLAVAADGSLNIADLLPAPREDTEGTTPPHLEISALTVNEARLDFSDASLPAPFETTLGPVSFTLEKFTTVGDPRAPYDFVASTESGESFRWRGRVSVNPIRSSGHFELSGLRPAKYLPYYVHHAGLEMREGVIGMQADYELAVGGEQTVLKVSDGRLDGQDVEVVRPGETDPVLKIDGLAIDGVALDLATRRMEVGAMRWSGGVARVTRDANGKIDWLAMGPEAEAEREAVVEEATAWTAAMNSLEWENIAVIWHDHTTLTPVRVEVSDVDLTVGRVDLAALDQPVTLGLVATLAEGGTVQAGGEVTAEPLKPALKLKLAGVQLAPLMPYAEQFVGYGLTGVLDIEADVGTAGEALVAQADVSLTGAELHGDAEEGLATWEALHVQGISWTSEPSTVDIASIRWIRPAARVVMTEEGELNWLQDIESPENAVDELTEKAADAMPVVRIQKVELVEAGVEFSDRSLAYPAAMSLAGFSGTLEELSSEEVGKARVSLTGKVNGSAPVAVAGNLNPLGRPAYSDVTLDFDRIDLLPTDGYMRKYAGYELQRGRLTLDVDFQLEDRQVRSETVATLDDFTLGAKVPSEDATKLPVPLAVALLKDRKGQIVIDVPVAGSLDDPEFRISRVVWRVIGNVLTKAATSPFNLLAGLVPGGGAAPENLDEHVFAPGVAELSPEARAKLDAVAKALKERPALNIGVGGQFDAERDETGLRPVILEQRLRAVMTAAGVEAAAANNPGQARRVALVELYREEFGELPIDPQGTLPPPSAPATPAATEAAPGNASTGADSRPAAKPNAPVDESLLGWLRRVFRDEEPKSDETTATDVPEAVATNSPAEPTPAPAELPALPVETIEARLLSRIEVAPAMLTQLATARATTVANYLRENGIAAERVRNVPAAEGGTRVKLTLQ